MSGDLVTSTASAATRAKERLTSALSDEKLAQKLILSNVRSRLQALDVEPSNEEIAEMLLGIG